MGTQGGHTDTPGTLLCVAKPDPTAHPHGRSLPSRAAGSTLPMWGSSPFPTSIPPAPPQRPYPSLRPCARAARGGSCGGPRCAASSPRARPWSRGTACRCSGPACAPTRCGCWTSVLQGRARREARRAPPAPGTAGILRGVPSPQRKPQCGSREQGCVPRPRPPLCPSSLRTRGAKFPAPGLGGSSPSSCRSPFCCSAHGRRRNQLGGSRGGAAADPPSPTLPGQLPLFAAPENEGACPPSWGLSQPLQPPKVTESSPHPVGAQLTCGHS